MIATGKEHIEKKDEVWCGGMGLLM